MTISLGTTCKIWTTWSQIWTFRAKFELFHKFEIWLFTYGFNALKGQFQISLGVRPNLTENLKYANDFNTFCQISNFKKSTPKGVGDLPAKRGRITTYPWASFSDPSLGPKSWTEPKSDDGDPLRQEHDRRRLPPEQPTQKGDHPWLT